MMYIDDLQIYDLLTSDNLVTIYDFAHNNSKYDAKVLKKVES